MLLLLAFSAACQAQSLISVATAAPTPPQQVASLIITGANSALVTQVAQYKSWHDAFWNNPNPAADPVSNVAALGANAARIFAAAAENVRHFSAIAAIAGKTLTDILPAKYQGPPAGWTITPHDDGTVTLTPPPH